MKITRNLPWMGVAMYLAVTSLCRADYHTNTITTPGGVFAFSVDNGPATNATIQLVAGVTNILVINTSSFHPVVVTTNPAVSAFYTNASPQNINAGQIQVKTPPSGFLATLYYMCHVHGFYGQINIIAPVSPTPPRNLILEVHVGTNIVMRSTGTNTTWLLVPEFSSNLVHGAWASVPSYTNTFANGTNTTVFPRLDPICGPNVYLRVRQQTN